MIQCDRCRDIILDEMEYEEIEGEGIVCEYCIEEEEIMKEDEENR